MMSKSCAVPPDEVSGGEQQVRFELRNWAKNGEIGLFSGMFDNLWDLDVFYFYFRFDGILMDISLENGDVRNNHEGISAVNHRLIRRGYSRSTWV